MRTRVRPQVDHGVEGPQDAHSYVPGLDAKPWHDAADHAWARELMAEWKVPADELKRALDPSQAAEISAEGYRVWAPAAREEGAAYGEDWRTLVLMDRGRWDEVRLRMRARVCAAIQTLSCPPCVTTCERTPKRTAWLFG